MTSGTTEPPFPEGADRASAPPAAPHPRSAALFEQVVEQVVDYAIIALDPQGVIETWNSGAQRLKGYTAQDAIGRSFAMFYTDQDRHAGLPMDLLLQARAAGRVQHTGWRLRKDGSRFWGDVIITALRDERGELVGFAKITRDRSDLKAIEDAQDSFYAAFNHDFRTPMLALQGFADALRDAPEDEREDLIQRVESNAEKLLQMLEDLMHFAQHRSSAHTMLVDDIDVAQTARDAVQQLGPSSRAATRVELDPDAVALARANGVAMHRVVTNLVVNALKYSPAESSVKVIVQQPTSATIELIVADAGRGIHPADLDSIFDEFQRGRLSQDDGGSGLGLASVKQLVEQQGGEVTIQSEPGVGTQVIVRLHASHKTPEQSSD